MTNLSSLAELASWLEANFGSNLIETDGHAKLWYYRLIHRTESNIKMKYNILQYRL